MHKMSAGTGFPNSSCSAWLSSRRCKIFHQLQPKLFLSGVRHATQELDQLFQPRYFDHGCAFMLVLLWPQLRQPRYMHRPGHQRERLNLVYAGLRAGPHGEIYGIRTRRKKTTWRSFELCTRPAEGRFATDPLPSGPRPWPLPRGTLYPRITTATYAHPE